MTRTKTFTGVLQIVQATKKQHPSLRECMSFIGNDGHENDELLKTLYAAHHEAQFQHIREKEFHPKKRVELERSSPSS